MNIRLFIAFVQGSLCVFWIFLVRFRRQMNSFFTKKICRRRRTVWCNQISLNHWLIWITSTLIFWENSSRIFTFWLYGLFIFLSKEMKKKDVLLMGNRSMEFIPICSTRWFSKILFFCLFNECSKNGMNRETSILSDYFRCMLKRTRHIRGYTAWSSNERTSKIVL